MSHLGRRILVGAVMGVLVLAGLMAYSDLEALQASFSAFDTWKLLPVLGLVCLGYALRVVKWQIYLTQLDVRLPWLESTWTFLAGLVMSITPAKVGEVLKSFLLKESRNIPIAQTAPIVVAERLTDLIALILLAAWGGALSGYGLELVGISALLTAALIGLIIWPAGCLKVIHWTRHIPGIKRITPKLEEAYRSMQRLMNWRTLSITTLLSILAWGGEGVAMWIICEAFAISTEPQWALFIFAFSTLAGALSMLPGGLLFTEASMIALIVSVFQLTASEEVATSITLVVRFCTLWFAVVLGFVALAIFKARYLKNPEPTDERDALEP